MAKVLETRFDGYIKAGIVRVDRSDLRKEFPVVHSCLTLSILTLQFTPLEYRLSILDRIFKTLAPGGAFILVEKVVGSTAELDKLFVDTYYNLKGSHGYSDIDIERKKLSLEGVLVPLTARWNEEMLRATGFRAVDCFYRWANFAGWIAVK